VDSGLGMDILKIVLGRQLGEKSGVNVGNGNTNTKGKEGSKAASEKEEDDAMEGDGGGDEMKSLKVVKGLGEDRRVIGAALAAVCNILTDFSPLRPVRLFFSNLALSLESSRLYFQIYLEENLMPRLIYIMKESGDPSLRLSALWAVKNVLRKTSTETKRDVMSHLGWPHLVEYVFILSYFDILVYTFCSGY
jgi:hypothetical protein